MAHQPFQKTKPSGGDTGPDFALDANQNDNALAEGALGGMLTEFDFEVDEGTGDATRPQFFYWKDGVGGSAHWLRAEIVWGSTGGAIYNPENVTWEKSVNGGSTWDAMSTQTFTWDANGNLVSVTGGSGSLVWVMQLLGHFWNQVDLYNTHVASSTAHGIGTLAAQNANAVAITGGNIKATKQQGVESAEGSKAAAFDLDCNDGHFFTVTVTNAAAAASFINKPAAGTYHPFHVRVVNGGIATDLFPGATTPNNAALGLTASGVDDVFGYIYDGSTVEITGVTKAKG
jgi:hypothetical protein